MKGVCEEMEEDGYDWLGYGHNDMEESRGDNELQLVVRKCVLDYYNSVGKGVEVTSSSR